MTASWTPRELATLAAIATAFVPGDDGERRASAIAEALRRAADPSQVAQLRIVLRAMESRVVNLALGAGPRSFSDMTGAQREAYLLDWGRSRIAQRRSVLSSLRKLSTFLAYADPGAPDAPNARLTAIEYRPDRPPVTTTPTTIRPEHLALHDGPTGEPLDLDADVVIVGSGAGGGVMAAALTAAGRSVVVLEAGPFVDEAAMPVNEMDAFDRLYLNHGLLATWDGAVTLLAGSGVGGGTLVNWMTTIDAPLSVRQDWARGHGLDGMADTEAWGADVAALETELGVTPVAAIAPKDDVILRGAAALGWEAAPIRRNGPDCSDCGSCAFGCRRGAKQSGIRRHLAEAHAAGARIVPRVRVTRVLLEGGRAIGVEGLALVPDPTTDEPMPDAAAPGGVRVRRLRVRAPQVVLAAGALRTPAILEGSGLDHPAIGRHLRVHPVSGVLAPMPDPVELWRGPMQGARSLQFVESEPGRAGYVIESAPGHPGLVALAMPWDGAAEHAAAMADLRRLGVLIAVTRDGGEGRVRLTRSGRVRIDYALDGTGVMTLRHAMVHTARLARAAGAREIAIAATPSTRTGPLVAGTAGDAAFERFLATVADQDVGPNRAAVFSAHQMGTVRMGADPADHACDPAGRVRRGRRGRGAAADLVVPGLYVADTSLFPTALGVNPMLTVMVLARRVARTVLAES